MVSLAGMLVAEFVGTFALTLVGILGIHHASAGGGLVAVALAHGLVLSVMVSATMHTSGAQFNPAVTIGLWLTGKMQAARAVAYIVTQLLAGIAAAAIVYQTHGALVVFNGTPNLAPTVSAATGLWLEVIATFFLVFVIWGTAVDSRARNVGGFGIGLAVAANILAFGPLTGASMNPARSFGPTLIGALAEGGGSLWANHWIYWVGPILGSVLAAVLYKAILMDRASTN